MQLSLAVAWYCLIWIIATKRVTFPFLFGIIIGLTIGFHITFKYIQSFSSDACYIKEDQYLGALFNRFIGDFHHNERKQGW